MHALVGTRPAALNVFEILLELYSSSLQYFYTGFSLATSAWVTRDGTRAPFHAEVMLASHTNANTQKQAHPPVRPRYMLPARDAVASARIDVFFLGLFDVARRRSCSGLVHLLRSRGHKLSAQDVGHCGRLSTVRRHCPISGIMRDHSTCWAMMEGAGAKRGDMMRLKQKSPGDFLSANANARGCVGHLEARRTIFSGSASRVVRIAARAACKRLFA